MKKKYITKEKIYDVLFHENEKMDLTNLGLWPVFHGIKTQSI